MTGVSPTATTINITDDDPEVKVSFGGNAYIAAEGGTATINVELGAYPERTVILLTKTNRNGSDKGTTSSADYSETPASLTFNAGDTRKSFTLRATLDRVDDDDESVLLGFGALPRPVIHGGPVPGHREHHR